MFFKKMLTLLAMEIDLVLWNLQGGPCFEMCNNCHSPPNVLYNVIG